MYLVRDDNADDITVIDNNKLQYGKGEDIVKVIDNDIIGTTLYKVIKVITTGLELSKEAINVLYIINDYYNITKEINIIRNNYIKRFNKSRNTFNRSYDELNKLGIVRRDINNYDNIVLNDNFNYSDVNKNAKYIVIEIKR